MVTFLIYFLEPKVIDSYHFLYFYNYIFLSKSIIQMIIDTLMHILNIIITDYQHFFRKDSTTFPFIIYITATACLAINACLNIVIMDYQYFFRKDYTTFLFILLYCANSLSPFLMHVLHLSLVPPSYLIPHRHILLCRRHILLSHGHILSMD